MCLPTYSYGTGHHHVCCSALCDSTAVCDILAPNNSIWHSCHSCEPNINVSYPYQNATAVFTAARDVDPGEQLTITYIDAERDVGVRQEFLAFAYGAATAIISALHVSLPAMLCASFTAQHCNNSLCRLTWHRRLAARFQVPVHEVQGGGGSHQAHTTAAVVRSCSEQVNGGNPILSVAAHITRHPSRGYLAQRVAECLPPTAWWVVSPSSPLT